MAEGQFKQNPDGSWSQQVVQTGRNVDEVIVLNAQTIIDTTARLTSEVDVSKYREYEVEFINTLADASAVAVSVKIGFALSGTAFGIPKNDGTIMTYTASGTNNCYHVVPSTTTTARASHLSMMPLKAVTALTATDVASFDPWKFIKQKFQISYVPSSVPTTGALTIKVKGVLN